MKQHWGAGDREQGTFPGGATLREGDRGWVLAKEEPDRALGRAMAWARGNEIADLHLVVNDAAGALARRAAAFTHPPTVWRSTGDDVVRTEAEPLRPPEPLPPELEPYVEVVRAAGADPVVEHGVLIGEVLGLEVVRIVADETGIDVQVGVGKHDREAQRLVHGDRSPIDALADAVASVRERRTPGAPAHPANQLAAERWLRRVVIAEPGIVGARRLEAVAPARLRDDLRVPNPAPAAGEDTDGAPVLVVCSTGIDLALVPSAVDDRLLDGREPRLVLVLPEGDDHPVTRDLASALREPAEIVTVERDWKSRQYPR
ncbi:MAG: hypothetical protein QOG87_3166 [Actinomycetota bacterium]